MQPLVTDIQRFSIHDGPGIRTVVFFKGCNLKCSWCQNPETMSLPSEIAFYAKKCESIGACKDVCTEDAILLGADIRIDRGKCNQCGLCVEACPSGALKIIGKEYSQETLLEEILKDREYYENSGGGITLSGGEATLHADFILDFLKKCKEHNLHTNIETNGYFSWNKFEPLLPYLDLIYFDIKIADNILHKEHASQGNERILENLKKLISVNAPVEFRMPLIPNYTTTPKNLNEVCTLLKDNQIKQIHLLPYHSMGEGKLTPISSEMQSLNLKPLSQNELDDIINLFESQEIKTITYR